MIFVPLMVGVQENTCTLIDVIKLPESRILTIRVQIKISTLIHAICTLYHAICTLLESETLAIRGL